MYSYKFSGNCVLKIFFFSDFYQASFCFSLDVNVASFFKRELHR